MRRDDLRRLLGHLKRALRMKQRLTVQEFYQLLELAEAIIDYGRMIEEYGRMSGVYCEHSPLFVIVEIPDLALRFRETPRTIKDALLLPRGMSRAEPIHLGGCWKLQLAGTLPCGRDGVHSATRHSHSVDDDKDDLGAA